MQQENELRMKRQLRHSQSIQNLTDVRTQHLSPNQKTTTDAIYPLKHTTPTAATQQNTQPETHPPAVRRRSGRSRAESARCAPSSRSVPAPRLSII